jgi:D-tyrosyl-tRNA(Tyr) deacylase
MRALVQRVKKASVTIDGREVASIGQGLVVLVGISRSDSPSEAHRLARKCWELRIFPDGSVNMSRSVREVGGSILVVSQFTLYADTSRGRRPSFTEAAPPQDARILYEEFCKALQDLGADLHTGRFGAMMEVELVNDGPVTIMLES